MVNINNDSLLILELSLQIRDKHIYPNETRKIKKHGWKAYYSDPVKRRKLMKMYLKEKWFWTF